MNEGLMSGIVNNEYIRSFLLGGKCQCLIKNIKSGNEFTYFISKNKSNSNMYFVNLVTGMGRIYCGYILVKEDEIIYNKGEKGQYEGNSMQIEALMYVLKYADNLPPYVIVQHFGKCARCGRKLTDLDSIRRGLGPDCASKVM